ncbi:hypothetical protein C8R46DRAFT_923378 [Mycena filopes]|nr:hypothetical protein C8R46DRAFT_923378 [Mycena filopes]
MQRFPAHNLPWPSERDLERLVQNASGQFVYAATVLKFVEDEYCHPMEQLRLILTLSPNDTEASPFADLDTLYSFILSANPNVPRVLDILGVWVTAPVCNTKFLDEILGLRPGSARSALRGLHSLLLIPNSDRRHIRLHHASIRDFLLSRHRAGIYFLDIQKHRDNLVLKYLSGIRAYFDSPEGHHPPLCEWLKT